MSSRLRSSAATVFTTASVCSSVEPGGMVIVAVERSLSCGGWNCWGRVAKMATVSTSAPAAMPITHTRWSSRRARRRPIQLRAFALAARKRLMSTVQRSARM